MIAAIYAPYDIIRRKNIGSFDQLMVLISKLTANSKAACNWSLDDLFQLVTLRTPPASVLTNIE